MEIVRQICANHHYNRNCTLIICAEHQLNLYNITYIVYVAIINSIFVKGIVKMDTKKTRLSQKSDFVWK